MWDDPDMLEEYDFTGGVRGKYAKHYSEGVKLMVSAAATTVVRMMESLPEAVQDRVVEHMQDYIEDMRDEMRWNESFAKSQDKLAAAAQKARAEIARGLASPLDTEFWVGGHDECERFFG
jgi:hypothetical protein